MEENQEPTPVWTVADAVRVFRETEALLHAAVQAAQQMTHKAHEAGDIPTAAVFDARAAVLFRAAMVAAAMTGDAQTLSRAAE